MSPTPGNTEGQGVCVCVSYACVHILYIHPLCGGHTHWDMYTHVYVHTSVLCVHVLFDIHAIHKGKNKLCTHIGRCIHTNTYMHIYTHAHTCSLGFLVYTFSMIGEISYISVYSNMYTCIYINRHT